MSTVVDDLEILKMPVRGLSRRWLGRLAIGGLAGLLLAGTAWAGDRWWTIGRFVETTDDAYAGGNITSVSPHVAGFVSQILVADNERVRAGQVLIRLDDRDQLEAADQAAAALAQRQAALAALEAKDRLQLASIRQAAADLSAKAAQADFATADAVRYAHLARADAASAQTAQKALALDRAARYAVVSSAAGVDSARQQLSVLDAQIAGARAALDQARAELTTARLDLSYTEIRSPLDGYVGNRAAQVGEYVSVGQYLASVIPSTGLWVDANFKENQLRRMSPGQLATVTADALPGHRFRGRVSSLARGTGAIFSVIPAQNATGNFTKMVQRVSVRIALDPGDPMLRALRPGLSTTVSVDTRPNLGADR